MKQNRFIKLLNDNLIKIKNYFQSIIMKLNSIILLYYDIIIIILLFIFFKSI
jgi:hypothetical protein